MKSATIWIIGKTDLSSYAIRCSVRRDKSVRNTICLAATLEASGEVGSFCGKGQSVVFETIQIQ